MTLEERIAIRNARQEEAARRFIGKVLDIAYTALKCLLVVAMLVGISD